MDKHTPGPWRYLRSGYGSKSADFDIVTDSGGRVASTPYEDKARLIAAAPELLAALAAIVKEIGPQFGINDDDTGTLHTVARIARAAIAKAKA